MEYNKKIKIGIFSNNERRKKSREREKERKDFK